MTRTLRLSAATVLASISMIGGAHASTIFFSTTGNPGEAVSAYDESTSTAADLYSFGDPADFSYNGPDSLPSTTDGQAMFFLVDTQDAGLSLFGVYDAVNDGSGGRVDTAINFAEGTGALIVRDDNNGNDSYSAGTTSFLFDQQWNSCCTDGFVIDVEADTGGAFDLTVDLSNIGGLTSFVFINSDGDEKSVVGDTFRLFTQGDDVVVPLPAAFPLAAVGFAGLMGLARRRRGV